MTTTGQTMGRWDDKAQPSSGSMPISFTSRERCVEKTAIAMTLCHYVTYARQTTVHSSGAMSSACAYQHVVIEWITDRSPEMLSKLKIEPVLALAASTMKVILGIAFA